MFGVTCDRQAAWFLVLDSVLYILQCGACHIYKIL